MRVFFVCFFYFFSIHGSGGQSGECSIISGMDRMSQVRKGGGSQGVNMKTGPYGEEGVWSNGRSVSARACVEASCQSSQVMSGHGRNAAAENRARPRTASQWWASWTASGAPRGPA